MNSKHDNQLNPLILASTKDQLPQIVNVPHLSLGRNDEICRYVNFIKKTNSTKRSFQRLPPEIRRRSMSYNVYRAPRKIRSTLFYEMSKAPPRVSKKKKKEKNKLPWIKRNLLHRAINQKNFCGEEFFPFKTRCLSEISTTFRKKGQRNIRLPFNQFKWMESHLYHSKRFQMCDAFGYKLPIHSNSKRNRKIYRAFRHGFVVHDSSYLQIFELKGTNEDISILFKLCNFNVDFLFSPDYFNSKFRGGGFLFKLDDRELSKISLNKSFSEQIHFYSWERVTPIEFIWTPTCKNCGSGRSLWIWMHPIASHQQFYYWEKCIELFGLNIYINLIEDVNRFEFLGPKSLKCIELFRCQYPPQAKVIVNEQDFVNNIDINLPLTFNSIKTLNETLDLSKFHSNLKDNFIGCTFFCHKYREDIRRKFRSSKNLLFNKFRIKSDKYYTPLLNTNSVRSRKRKNIKTLLSSIIERNEKCSTPCNHKLKSLKETQKQKSILSKVLIIVHQGSNLGFDLIFPRGLNSSLLLRYLHFLSAKVIGIGERRKLFTQLGIPMFPFDFIETLSNQKLQISNPIYTKSKKFLKEICNEVLNITSYIKTPPSKRVNYFFNKIEFPFLINWNKILCGLSEENSTFQSNSLVLNQTISTYTPDEITEVKSYNIFVTRVGYRGTNKEYENATSYISKNPIINLKTLILVKVTSSRKISHKAHIYMCENNDINEIKKKNYLIEEPNKHGKVCLKGNSTNRFDFFNCSQGFHTLRKLVGIVTSGGYSMSMKRGIGIGYISLFSLIESYSAQNKEPLLFWIRNHSLKYIPVKIEKYNSTNFHFNIH